MVETENRKVRCKPLRLLTPLVGNLFNNTWSSFRMVAWEQQQDEEKEEWYHIYPDEKISPDDPLLDTLAKLGSYCGLSFDQSTQAIRFFIADLCH